MHALLDSLIQLLVALWDVVISLIGVIVPWLPLIAWIAFWLCAVDWTRLRVQLLKGGWIGLLLIAVVSIVCWWAIAPPVDGSHYILGLKLSNIVGKTVYVTFLVSIMFICGSLQLSGALPQCCRYAQQPEAEAEHAHH